MLFKELDELQVFTRWTCHLKTSLMCTDTHRDVGFNLQKMPVLFSLCGEIIIFFKYNVLGCDTFKIRGFQLRREEKKINTVLNIVMY